MGLIFKKERDNLIIGVWKTTESLTQLTSLSKEISTTNLNSQKRKKEWLSIRLLLSELDPLSKIIYDRHKAPKTNNSKKISISHCDDLSCLILSKKNTGIDIQKVSRKAIKTINKFAEIKNFKNLTEEKATLIWSAKECIYKWHRKGGINFKKDIIIEDFEISQNGTIEAFFNSKIFVLNYLKIEDQFLVYICKCDENI